MLCCDFCQTKPHPCDGPLLISPNHTTMEWLGLEVTSGDFPSATPQPKQVHPGQFGISPRKEIAEPLWAASSLCSVISQQFLPSYSRGTSCIPVCARCPLSCHWKESGPIPLAVGLKILVCIDKILSQLSVLKAEQPSPLSLSPELRCSWPSSSLYPLLDPLQSFPFPCFFTQLWLNRVEKNRGRMRR